MNFKLIQLGNHPAVLFAAEQLHAYLRRMDSRVRISRIRADRCMESAEQALYIGIDPAFEALLPKVGDPFYDDGIYINVTNGSGIII